MTPFWIVMLFCNQVPVIRMKQDAEEAFSLLLASRRSFSHGYGWGILHFKFIDWNRTREEISLEEVTTHL